MTKTRGKEEATSGGVPTLIDSILTPYEIKVVNLLPRKNLLIATALRITESTVKVHIRNAMRKLGVSNRTELALLIQQMNEGYVIPQPPQESSTRCICIKHGDLTLTIESATPLEGVHVKFS